MLRALAALDRLLATSRPTWLWVGQVAVVVLGVHRAADQVDDALAAWVREWPVAWPDPELPLSVATWTALGLELAVCIWIAGVLLLARADAVTDLRAWGERFTLSGFLAPLLVCTAGAGGLWGVQMALEDALAPNLAQAAGPLAWGLAALVGARLILPALARVLRRMPAGRPWRTGWLWAPPVLWISAQSLLHGLPIWGWLG